MNFVTKQRLLVLMLIAGCLTVVYFSQQLPPSPLLSDNPAGITKKRSQVLCLGDGNVVKVPDADGYVIERSLPADQWPLYFAANETDRRIFFHETGGSAHIDAIQCCAVESASFHHPDRPVHLLIRPPTDCSDDKLRQSILNQPCFKVLDHYENAAAILLNENHYVAGTPFENWYRNGEWLQSPYEKAHLADYFRMLTMSKGGGLYLDLDMITLKEYGGKKFRNFFVFSDNSTADFSNGAMHLERGHWLIDEIVQLMAEDYKPDSYIFNGPDVITEVMNTFCRRSSGHPKVAECRTTIQVLSDQLFYIIPSPIANQIFMDHGADVTKMWLDRFDRISYGLHLWVSSVPKDIKASIDVNSNQLISILFRQHCPIVVKSFHNKLFN